MCGRFTLHSSAQEIAEIFDLNNLSDIEPQYNIAPTQLVGTILNNSEDNTREYNLFRWGLIPSWAKDKSMGAKLINARAETVAEKPSFRNAFKRRRCLIVADGFYEWQKTDGKKQPFYFRLNSEQPFGFAGLWSKWESPEGEEINSCTILTTEANELLKPLHDRMPVILFAKDYDLWLDPKVQASEPLQKLLNPYPESAMTGYPVSTIVNNPKHNGSDCIATLSKP
ncbi:MAG: SOS response-associated peptidase [Scytonematopsis contorta HA4267-MV1]|jgi:putative SOS response-associated peptidase YedK|nr:SOS response-associated peptidase [Scytonematopsis contorta HA4267-MV1]